MEWITEMRKIFRFKQQLDYADAVQKRTERASQWQNAGAAYCKRSRYRRKYPFEQPGLRHTDANERAHIWSS